MKSRMWSTALGSPVKVAARPVKWELSRLSAPRLERSCRLFIIRLNVACSPAKSSSGAQQIKIQRRFNLDSVFAVRAPPRQPSPILVGVESLVDEGNALNILAAIERHWARC